MKKKKIHLIAGVLLCSMLLGGCGTHLYEMTDEEEEIIVRYAAYLLAKHNVYQKDGLLVVNNEVLEDATEEEETVEEVPEESETESGEDMNSSEWLTPDMPENSISLADAIGYDGQLQITYTGFDIADNFQEGKVYSLDAHSGYTFVVAKFLMTNTTDATVDVNVLSKNVTFRMAYEGSAWVKQDITLLLSDLSTYTGSLAIGESKELVVLFEVPVGEVESVGELAFSVDKDGQSYAIVY